MSNWIRRLLLVFLAGAGVSLAQTSPGDADGDGRFTPQDIGVVASQILGFGTAAGQPDCNGDAGVDVLDLFCIANRFPTQLVQSSPLNGEPDVALTRETILRFSAPLDAATVTAASVHAEFGGQPLAARLYVSRDKKSVTLFYDAALPASGRIRVTVDGGVLEDAQGRPVDADGDFVEGGLGLVDFDTLTLSTVPGTVLCGRVFATALAPGSQVSVNEPLQGVTITADGAEDTMRATTDAKGDFCLDPAPAGVFFVHIDGRTATNGVPLGTYYPYVGKSWESVPGKMVNTMDVFLPLVPQGTLQPVSTTQETQIEFVPEVLAGHPEFEGVSVTVPADSLFADDGTRGGMVGIAPVPPDRMPGPLPPGLEFPVVITVQTDGATNFDLPAPACFPNLPMPSTGQPLPAGTKSALFSFNHDTGRFEVEGPMTVTADERLVCTDPGIGILAPGWHGTQPGSSGSGGGGGPPGCSRAAAQRGQCVPTCPPGSPERKACDRAGRDCGFANGAMVLTCGPCATVDPTKATCIGCIVAIAWMIDACMRANDDCRASGCPGYSRGDVRTELRAFLAAASPVLNELRELLITVEVTGTMTDEQAARVQTLWEQLNDLAGGDVQATIARFSDLFAAEQAVEQIDVRAEGTPEGPIFYAGMTEGRVVVRGQTDSRGGYSLILGDLPTPFVLGFFDPRTTGIGFSTQREVRGNGRIFRFDDYFLGDASGFSDVDGDSLPDVAEQIIGTGLGKPDTDGDGVNDGAEVDQGTNPLDGLPSQTGVIATADTPGTAVDVCALDDLVAIADSAAGVSVFNVFNGMNPTIIAQVDTPGDARRVACAGDRIAVADGNGGLAVVDVSDPPAARIVHQLSFPSAATAVATAGGIAYVGLAGGQLLAVDLESGTLVESLATGSDIHDLAIEGETLFVARASDLRAYSLVPGFPALLGTASPLSFFAEPISGRRRLYAGGGHVYVACYVGYDVFDVRNPAAMQRVGSAVDNGTFRRFKQVVPNGSGLGIAATGIGNLTDGTHQVSLYDVSDPTKTDQFLSTFTTPGETRAVSIYNGLAYAADGTAGLQVVNYLAYDALGIAPSVTLSTNVQGTQVQEGALVLATASVSDDVQVRNVEFLLDGQVIRIDGNFPFELQFFAPLDSQQQSFTLAARATDTGGNRTTSAVQTFQLVPDTFPPTVLAFSPTQSAVLHRLLTADIRFSESMGPATLDAAGVRLAWAGPDDTFGNSDDQALVTTISVLAQDRRIVVRQTGAAPLGKLRLTLDGSKLRDRAGNLLDGDGNGTPGGDFVLETTRSALTLTYGSNLTATADPSNDPTVIEFAGAPGKIASLLYTADQFNFDVRVLAPDGTEIANTTTVPVRLLDLPVGQSGLYRIEMQVSLLEPPTTVTIGLSDQPLETLPALAFNTPVDTSLSAFQDVDDWPFAATAGQMLSFHARSLSNPQCMILRVLRLPARALLASSSCGGQFIEDFTIPATGQYLLQVYTAGFSTNPSTYRLSMGRPGLDVHPISYAQTATDSLDYEAHIIWYELTATAGDVVSLTRASGAPRYQLLAPDGTVSELTGAQILDVALTQSGTHRIQIRTLQGIQGLGSFTFGLSDQPLESLPPLALDTPVNSTFNNFADVDDRPLSATAGQVLTFTATQVSGNVPRVRLLRASDRAVLALGTNASPSTITNFTIPATGQYIVQVFIRNFNVAPGSGSYTLTVSD